MNSELTVIARAMPPAIQRCLRFRTRTVYGDHGYDGSVIASASIVGALDEGTIRQGLAVLERSKRPGGNACAVKALTELRALTASRSADGDDLHLIAKSYTERLAVYPADVIVEACRACADASRWWPTWHELKVECDRLMVRRRAEHRALTEALKAGQAAAPDPKAQLQAEHAALAARIKSHRDVGNDDLAAVHEARLAVLELRPIEDWARVAIAAKQATRRTTKERQIDMTAMNRQLHELADARRRRIVAGEDL